MVQGKTSGHYRTAASGLWNSTHGPSPLERREPQPVTSGTASHSTVPGGLWTDYRPPPLARTVTQPDVSGSVTLPPIWKGGAANSPLDTPQDTGATSRTRQRGDRDYRRFPLEDVQEACLMRYYIEEIGQWVRSQMPRPGF